METSIQSYLSVNGEIRAFEASLAVVLHDYGIDLEHVRGVAVAVNDGVIRKGDWLTYTLSPDDRVEIVTARQGG